MRQIDAQAARIVAGAGHVVAQTRRIDNHRNNAVFGVLAGGDFVRENVHHRAGAAVDAPAHEVVSGFGTAGLRAFADDDRFHARRSGGVHDAHKVRREQIFPFAGDAGHLQDAMAFGPLADGYRLAASHDFALSFGKSKPDGRASGLCM